MTTIEIDEVKEMMKSYTGWLSDKTILKRINEEWVEITTPNLDRHNDYLQIYICRERDYYLLTDDGYIIDDLESSGCSLKSPRRKELFDLTIMGFGVQMEHDRLIMKATRDNFPLKKHNLLQAMLAINDLFYLSSPHITNLFYENVVEWFDESDIRYAPRVKFTGKSGYDIMFDFVIPKSKRSPERLIQLANVPNKDKVQMLMFKWIDIRAVRGVDVLSYVILNDKESSTSPPAIDALLHYDSIPIAWTEREKFKAELVA
jgi:hypothetical protein